MTELKRGSGKINFLNGCWLFAAQLLLLLLLLDDHRSNFFFLSKKLIAGYKTIYHSFSSAASEIGAFAKKCVRSCLGSRREISLHVEVAAAAVGKINSG